ncbi:hypothetical protein FRC03_000998 [Tulasnella sp. 419]|nr:hypothetical protein FRC03_000998 [Tulasnella sp. 419]
MLYATSRSRTATEEQHLLPKGGAAYTPPGSPSRSMYPSSSSPQTHRRLSSHHSAAQHQQFQQDTTYKRRETPHDVALLELNVKLAQLHAQSAGSSSGPNKAVGHDPSTSSRPLTLPGLFPSTPEPTFDPYTGNPRGVLVNRNAVQHQQESTSGTVGIVPHTSRTSMDLFNNATTDANDAVRPSISRSHTANASGKDADMWASLAKIRVLQSDLARKHIAMESLSHRGDGGGTASRRSSFNQAAPGEGQRGRKRKGSKSGEESDSKPGQSSAAEGARSQSRTRSLRSHGADEFAGRKEAIDDIMRKLDDLSAAVKGFHDLPNSTPPSRSNTLNANGEGAAPAPYLYSGGGVTTGAGGHPVISINTAAFSSPSMLSPAASPPLSPSTASLRASARSPLPPILDHHFDGTDDDDSSGNEPRRRTYRRYAESLSATQVNLRSYR